MKQSYSSSDRITEIMKYKQHLDSIYQQCTTYRNMFQGMYLAAAPLVRHENILSQPSSEIDDPYHEDELLELLGILEDSDDPEGSLYYGDFDADDDIAYSSDTVLTPISLNDVDLEIDLLNWDSNMDSENSDIQDTSSEVKFVEKKSENRISIPTREKLVCISEDSRLHKLKCLLVKKGNRSKVELTLQKACIMLNKRKQNRNALLLLNDTVYRNRPIIWLRDRYSRGRKFTIPVYITKSSQINRSIRWITEGIAEKLARSTLLNSIVEVLGTSISNRSILSKKKQQLYNTARMNKQNLFLYKRR